MDRNRHYRYYSTDRGLFTFLVPTVRITKELEDNRVRVQALGSGLQFECHIDRLVILPTLEMVTAKRVKHYLKQPFAMTRDMFEQRFTVSFGGKQIQGDQHEIVAQIREYKKLGTYQQYLHFPI